MAVQSVLSLRRLGTPVTVIKSTAIVLCQSLTPYSYAICSGLVNMNADVMFYIIDAKQELDSDTICAVVLQDMCDMKDDRYDWAINIDWSQSTPTAPKYEIPASQGSNDIRIVHISDTHHDPNYRVGMNAVCGEPACCRYRQGTPEFESDAAGKWGDYRDCDAPWEAIEDLFQHVHETQQVC